MDDFFSNFDRDKGLGYKICPKYLENLKHHHHEDHQIIRIPHY